MQQQWRRSKKKERGDETQFTTKIGGKTSLGPKFCKNLVPSYAFDALLCRNWPFSSPNRLTSMMILLNWYYFKSLPSRYWYEAGIAPCHVIQAGMVRSLVPVYIPWSQLGTHATLV
jgi:hypothetical protein